MPISRFSNPFRRTLQTNRLYEDMLGPSQNVRFNSERIPEPNIGNLDPANLPPLRFPSDYGKKVRSLGVWEKPRQQQILPLSQKLKATEGKPIESQVLPFAQRIQQNIPNYDYGAFNDFNNLIGKQENENNRLHQLAALFANKNKAEDLTDKRNVFDRLKSNVQTSRNLEREAELQNRLQIFKDRKAAQNKSNILSALKDNALRRKNDRAVTLAQEAKADNFRNSLLKTKALQGLDANIIQEQASKERDAKLQSFLDSITAVNDNNLRSGFDALKDNVQDSRDQELGTTNLTNVLRRYNQDSLRTAFDKIKQQEKLEPKMPEMDLQQRINLLKAQRPTNNTLFIERDKLLQTGQKIPNDLQAKISNVIKLNQEIQDLENKLKHQSSDPYASMTRAELSAAQQEAFKQAANYEKYAYAHENYKRLAEEYRKKADGINKYFK